MVQIQRDPLRLNTSVTQYVDWPTDRLTTVSVISGLTNVVYTSMGIAGR
ncbi:hypothetical protein [Bifidobacterium sp. ESL0800]|nr:hypothetical protein [Bifidobacterium sp. ESL0800]WEV76195.1 hypothetical protein OZX75_03135 [Bifidobacterium sp. ESL0800]